MNTSSIIYLKENKFYLKYDSRLLETSKEEFINNEYQLLIDDHYFFYESLEIPSTSKKKQLSIIKNFLLVNYPEELITHFNYVNIKDMTVIYIFTKKLLELLEKQRDVFQRAYKISSPFIESLHIYDNFNYKIDNIIYNIANRQITHINESNENVKTSDDVRSLLNDLSENLNIIKKDSTFTIVKSLKIPILLVLISYIIFISGEILRLKAIINYLGKHDALLTDIYKSAGVINSKDPYGSLLAKVKSNANFNNRAILLNIEKISKSTDNQTIIDSINIRKNSMRFDGITKDYSSLENFTANLRKNMNKNVNILNTKKEDDHIIFSLRIG
jgi:hypothetical protein